MYFPLETIAFWSFCILITKGRFEKSKLEDFPVSLIFLFSCNVCVIAVITQRDLSLVNFCIVSEVQWFLILLERSSTFLMLEE